MLNELQTTTRRKRTHPGVSQGCAISSQEHRHGGAPKRRLRPVAVVALLACLFLFTVAAYSADKEPTASEDRRLDLEYNSTPGESSTDSAYALREASRLEAEFRWALDRLIDGPVDPDGVAHLVEATKHCHDKVRAIFGPNDWRTRMQLAELHRYQDVSTMNIETQRAYWRGRSDLKRARAPHLRQLVEGRFRDDSPAKIANSILDAVNRIARVRPADRDVIEGYLAIAELSCLRKDYGSASKWVAKAQEVCKKCEQSDALLTASHEMMGIVYCGRAEYDCAAKELELALLVERKEYGSINSPTYGMCLLNLAFVRVQQSRFLEAEAYCIEAKTILRPFGPVKDRFIGRILTGASPDACNQYCLANIYVATGELEKAETAMKRYWSVSYPRDSNIPCPNAAAVKLAERIERERTAGTRGGTNNGTESGVDDTQGL